MALAWYWGSQYDKHRADGTYDARRNNGRNFAVCWAAIPEINSGIDKDAYYYHPVGDIFLYNIESWRKFKEGFRNIPGADADAIQDSIRVGFSYFAEELSEIPVIELSAYELYRFWYFIASTDVFDVYDKYILASTVISAFVIQGQPQDIREAYVREYVTNYTLPDFLFEEPQAIDKAVRKVENLRGEYEKLMKELARLRGLWDAHAELSIYEQSNLYILNELQQFFGPSLSFQQRLLNDANLRGSEAQG